VGISSTGILYWGLDFGEDRPWLHWEDDSLDSRLMRSKQKLLARLQSSSMAIFEWEDDELDPDDCIWMANGAKQSDTWAVRNEASKDLGVEMICHCSYDYSMWGLGVTESVNRASRGHPMSLKELIVKPEWEVMLWIAREKLAAKFGPRWLKGDPSWILTSVYG